MLQKLLDILQTITESISNTSNAISAICASGAILMVISTVLLQWLNNLSTIQIVFLCIAIGFVFIIIVVNIISWKVKKDIDSIPKLITKLDHLTMEYIDKVDRSKMPEQLLKDMANLMNMNIDALMVAKRSGNKDEIASQMERFNNKYANYMNVKNKGKDTLMNLLLIAETLNEHHVGLDKLTDTFKYKAIYTRIRGLQKQVPVKDINNKINEYFRWSKGLYSALLSTKPIIDDPELQPLLPIRQRAINRLLPSTTEDHISTLISAVRESIVEARKKDKD